MKALHEISQAVVWKHWKQLENATAWNIHADIRDPLPADTQWYSAEIEPEDIDSMYVISSGDWLNIAGNSFSVKNVLKRLNMPTHNENTKRISDDIRQKIAHLNSGGKLDSRLIAVTESKGFDGSFTFIDGNRRSISFLETNTLIGTNIYLGVSSSMKKYKWANQTYSQ